MGIGFGLPGLINPESGIVTFLPNIAGWKKVPLKKIMEEKTGLKTFIDNDVNLVTLGEWQFGAGIGSKNLICMTLGTGVGSGLIFNGALYRGEGFVAGELGHMPLNEKGLSCNCGGEACFERYVGNRYLMARAGKIFKNKNIQLEEVFALAEHGNVRAVQFWEEVAGIVKAKGGEIHLHHKVTGIKHQNGRVVTVEVKKSATNEKMTVEGDYFFSTMPVTELFRKARS